MLLVAHFCAIVTAAALCIGGAHTSPDPYATQPVFFYGTQVGVYEDDQQPGQCLDAAIERTKWALVIAGNAPGAYPQDECSSATFNALEWGQYWGPPPSADAYILENASLGPLTAPAPILTRQARKHHPSLLVLNP